MSDNAVILWVPKTWWVWENVCFNIQWLLHHNWWCSCVAVHFNGWLAKLTLKNTTACFCLSTNKYPLLAHQSRFAAVMGMDNQPPSESAWGWVQPCHPCPSNSSKNSNHSEGKTNILWSEEACLKTSTYSDKSIKKLNFT